MARHCRDLKGVARAQCCETLALCTLHAGGRGWQALFSAALEHYLHHDHALDVARIQKYLGQALLDEGSLTHAEQYLLEAKAGYEAIGRFEYASIIETLLARRQLLQGKVSAALEQVHAAVQTLEQLNNPQGHAFGCVERARILAYHGHPHSSTRDLVAAERILGVSPNYGDRMRTRLVRAETLIALGQTERALPSLHRIRHDVRNIDNARIRAKVYIMLGHALIEKNPREARNHLVRAKHLYDSLGFNYWVTHAELALAHVELREGLSGSSQLRNTATMCVESWPLLEAMRDVALAEISGTKDPNAARESLIKVRRRAFVLGNAALMQRVQRLLENLKLDDEGIAVAISRLRSRASDIIREEGENTVPDGFVPTPMVSDKDRPSPTP